MDALMERILDRGGTVTKPVLFMGDAVGMAEVSRERGVKFRAMGLTAAHLDGQTFPSELALDEALAAGKFRTTRFDLDHLPPAAGECAHYERTMRRARGPLGEAVDAAVREVCGVAGVEHQRVCNMHAIAASVLAKDATEVEHNIQAGSLHVRSADDPELYYAMVAEDDGVRRGEFHCWNVGVLGEVPYEIDTSIGRYGRYLLDNSTVVPGAEAPPKEIVPLPPTLWDTAHRVRGMGVSYEGDRLATMRLYEYARDHTGVLRDVVRLARTRFRRTFKAA